MEIGDRISKYVTSKGITIAEFERISGLGNGYVRKIRNTVGRRKLEDILSAFPDLNRVWLLTGEGQMILNENRKEETEPQPAHVIKYYPNVNGSMGGVAFLDDPDETVCNISIPGYNDCNFAINAYGDSMYHLIKSGQIILMSEWLEHFIDWGRIYLVITNSGYRVVKRLYPGESKDTITCKSENIEANPPFQIEKADITKIYLVKGWICRDAI